MTFDCQTTRKGEEAVDSDLKKIGKLDSSFWCQYNNNGQLFIFDELCKPYNMSLNMTQNRLANAETAKEGCSDTAGQDYCRY